MIDWKPFLDGLGKYSWRSMFGVFAVCVAALFFGPHLGLSVWLEPKRSWVIVVFIASSAVLLTHVASFLVEQFRKRKPNGRIHFVQDGYNMGWAKQNDTEMSVRIGGKFTYTGPGQLVLLGAFLKGTSVAPDLMAQVPSFDGSGKQISTQKLWLQAGVVQEAFLNLRLTPVLGTPGKELRREMLFRDNFNRNFSIGKVELPYRGPAIIGS